MNLKKYFDAANAAEARVQALAAQINDLFEAEKNDEALKLRPSLDKAKTEAHEAHQLYLSMAAATTPEGDPAQRFVPTGGDPEPKEVTDMRASKEYANQFWGAFRNGVSPKTIKAGMHSGGTFPLLMNALSETGGSPAGAEGGFLNPVDFDNMIKELQRLAVDLANYFNVETVTAYSGWRAVETAAAALPFATVTESAFPSGERIAAMESPTFTKVEYTVVDYAGYLPVANDLLSDTPANIMAYLARWCGRKVSLTNTSLLLTLLNALSSTAVTDYKKILSEIKKALNVTLDPAISASASIFCNQSGLDLMDQLEDGTGRPMLQTDPSNATAYRVKGRPVVVVPTSQWADLTATARTRICVGDGHEMATFFKRAAMEMAATTVGGTAWRNNNTEVRAIMRAVAKTVDAGAMNLLTVTLP
jgi:HK97 family phage major capsid protein